MYQRCLRRQWKTTSLAMQIAQGSDKTGTLRFNYYHITAQHLEGLHMHGYFEPFISWQ